MNTTITDRARVLEAFRAMRGRGLDATHAHTTNTTDTGVRLTEPARWIYMPDGAILTALRVNWIGHSEDMTTVLDAFRDAGLVAEPLVPVLDPCNGPTLHSVCVGTRVRVVRAVSDSYNGDAIALNQMVELLA